MCHRHAAQKRSSERLKTVPADLRRPRWVVRVTRGPRYSVRVFVASLLIGAICGCRTVRGDGAALSRSLPAEGLASFYGAGFQGRRTANGERFDKEQLTAAHRTLPFGACVKVTSLENHRSVHVRVNDRGPLVGGRIIDVSEAAARELAMIAKGVAPVRIEACPESDGDPLPRL
jgi:rare lipoprotein A